MLDSISDTLLNAFSRVRKPDERFLDMREGADKFEEGVTQSERLWNRLRSRSNGESDLVHVCAWVSEAEEMAVPNPVKT